MNLAAFRSLYCPSTPLVDGVAHHQGWNSNSSAFDYVFEKTKPASVIEVGSWLGQSAMYMSSLMNEPNILCVDIWLPSHNLTWSESIFDVTKGFDLIYKQFCVNITDRKMNDRISPLPMASAAAAELLAKLNVTADIIYIDAGHTKRECYADLQDWWPLANKGIIGDDYNGDWPGVVEAADQFAKDEGLILEEHDRKFVLFK